MKHQLIASIGIGALVLNPALAQTFNVCTSEGDGTFTPHFNVVPSMVVHSDAVMDTTRDAIGLDGAANERAFSFSRTIASILGSAGGDTSAASQEALVQSMLGTFIPAEALPLNAKGGVVMPLDARGEAESLNAASMLDESHAQGMKPLALFNRFDLAPENWAHCGEHRIIYGRKPATDGAARFLLIFEGMVPNPNPAAGEEGCRPIAEFWANLSEAGLNETEITRRLSGFFYEGKTSPELSAPDMLRPVVDYRNYGGDGGRGQVRANAFNPPPWQLREWLTQRTFNPASGSLPVTFVPVTVKDNPLAELYRDELTGTAFLAKNPAASANLLHGEFLQALTSTIAFRLLSETTVQHQTLVNELELYKLGSGVGAEVTPDTVLFNTIALGNEDKFNEFQSTSQGLSDAPGESGTSVLVTQMLTQVGSSAGPFVSTQSGEVLLNRARAATCAGCHMTASRSAGGFGGPGVVVLEKQDGTVLRWPDVDPGGFVQVSESRVLSPTLTDAFLPFRRYVLSRYLCKARALTPHLAAADNYEPFGDMPELRTVAAAVGEELVDETANGGYFIDDLVAQFAAGAGVAQPVVAADATALADSVNRNLDALTPEQLAALREKVNHAISLARSIEQQRPGAFVETRRPH